MNRFTEEDIFRYLDQETTAPERKQFERELGKNELLRARFEQLRAVHESLLSMPLERASEKLTDQVMSKVQQAPPTGFYNTYGIFSGTGFLLVSGILTALVALISLFSSGYLDPEALRPSMEGRLFEEWTYLKGILSKKMLTNAMLVIYGILALALLDRAILNPLFRRKFKGFSF